MTEDISKYVFDFDTEVETLRRELGEKDATTVFVEATLLPPDSPETAEFSATRNYKVNLHTVGGEKVRNSKSARAILQNEASYYSGSGPYRSPRCVKIPQYSDTEEADRLPVLYQLRYKSSFSNELKTADIVGHIILLSKNKCKDFDSMDGYEAFGVENKNLMPLSFLIHEFGHSVIDKISDSERDENDPFCECAADAYFAIRHLQRFGRDAEPLLSRISWERSLQALAEVRTGHLTSTVIDRIIADSAHIDFSQFSAQQTIDLARDYATKWSPDISVISAAREFLITAHQKYVLAESDATDKMNILAAACFSSASADLAAYIGSRVVQPLLQPEGVIFNGKSWRLSDEMRQAYADGFEERAGMVKLSVLFNNSAKKESDLAAFIKASTPSDKKPFIANREPYMI